SYVYLEVMSKHFSKSEKIPIIHDNGSLFIHTDKPVYTPQEPVKVGVYSLDDDLEPVTRGTVLTFIDPEGSEVDTIQGNNHTAIVSFPDFKIPSNPKALNVPLFSTFASEFKAVTLYDIRIVH
ncbi:complement C5-like isoform X1, partial [Cricetulus griseus]|uniref:complement C5-like isoform X1 n=1 Tax=Cricetulus griseus TaxID=10029 RepID=UPI0004546345